ncbi:MAG: IS66 family transposase, partial [Candidatus Ventricola sp.]
MKQDKIAINRDTVKGLDRNQLEDVLFAVYNDNIAFRKRVEELEALVAELTEFKKLANAEKYTPSSEAIQGLFPELEVMITYAEPAGDEKSADGGEAKKEGRPRKKRTPNLVLPANADVAIIDNTIGVPDTKTEDGTDYERGEDEVILKLGYTPAKRKVVKLINPTWVPVGQPEDGEVEKMVDFENDKIDALACDASTVANIVVSKFDDHIPLYRYSEICAREGVDLSRQTISNWLQTYYGELADFDNYFSDQVFRMNAINQDETRVEVLDVRTASGKVSSSSSVTIRVGTTFDEEKRQYRRIVSMGYSNGKSREKLFDGFGRLHYHGPLLTDGLAGYLDEKMFPQKMHAVCWVHAVRHFKKYAKLNPSNGTVMELLVKHAELYRIEDSCRARLESGKISTEEFLSERKCMAKPVIDGIYKLIDEKYPLYVVNDELGKGLAYLREYKDNLYVYLDHVELTPDNNICERTAKAFATGRKNWLFAKSVDGIDASCF